MTALYRIQCWIIFNVWKSCIEPRRNNSSNWRRNDDALSDKQRRKNNVLIFRMPSLPENPLSIDGGAHLSSHIIYPFFFSFFFYTYFFVDVKTLPLLERIFFEFLFFLNFIFVACLFSAVWFGWNKKCRSLHASKTDFLIHFTHFDFDVKEKAFFMYMCSRHFRRRFFIFPFTLYSHFAIDKYHQRHHHHH